MPGGKVVSEVSMTPAGVPVVLSDDGVLTLSDEHQGFLLAECMDDPMLVDMLERRMRLGVENIVGLDADLPMDDWYGQFQMLLTINQFITPLRVLQGVRRSLDQMESDHDR
jgi:hypothetical protein